MVRFFECRLDRLEQGVGKDGSLKINQGSGRQAHPEFGLISLDIG
jgi:hypothetical protein